MGFFKSWSAKITAFITENVTDDLYLPVTIGAKLMFLVLIFLVVDFISILFWKYFSKFLVKILGSKSILKEIYKQKAWRSLAHFFSLLFLAPLFFAISFFSCILYFLVYFIYFLLPERLGN